MSQNDKLRRASTVEESAIRGIVIGQPRKAPLLWSEEEVGGGRVSCPWRRFPGARMPKDQWRVNLGYSKSAPGSHVGFLDSTAGSQQPAGKP